MVVGWTLVVVCAVLIYSSCAVRGAACAPRHPRERGRRAHARQERSQLDLQSLILDGVMGAFSGFAIALGNGSVQPDDYGTRLTFLAYAALILGGAGRVVGPIVGAMTGHHLAVVPEEPPHPVGQRRLLPRGGGVAQRLGAVRFILLGVSLMALSSSDRRASSATDGRARARCPLTPWARRARPGHGPRALDGVAARRRRRQARPDPRGRRCVRRYGGCTAVDVDHLEVQRGVITAFIGPNGAGKTTFFDLLTGFDKAQRGLLGLRGPEGHGVAPTPSRGAGMVRTFQLTKALTRMTVLDNMRLGATDQGGELFLPRAAAGHLKQRQQKQIDERAARPAARFKLDAKREQTSPAACPAASASCSRWRGRSWSSRRSSCSTSRWPG